MQPINNGLRPRKYQMVEETPENERSKQDLLASDASRKIEEAVSGVPPIPYHLVEKHHNKTTKLLSNSGTDTSIQAKNRWHDYAFSSPLFLAFVDIEGSDIADSDEYRFKAKVVGGRMKEFRGHPRQGKLRIDINEFVESFSFKPPSIFWSVFLRSPEIQRVSLWGFQQADISDFLYKISRVQKIKNDAVAEITSIRDETNALLGDLTSKESELATINDDIASAETSLTTLNTNIAEKEAQDSELQSKIDRSENQLESINQQVAERRAELDTVTKGREAEKQAVDEAKATLKKLNENINLFPSEISGFVNQASEDIKSYTNYTVGLIAIICILFIWVLSGAFDLSEFVKDNPDREVWPLLLAKLPLAIVVSALVAAAYKISRVFIAEILKINQQKLSLTQVSIIAKDVSQSAEHGLNLNEVQTYGLRLRTKMALLSDHIGTFVPSDAERLLPQGIFDSVKDGHEDEADELTSLVYRPDPIDENDESERSQPSGQS